MNCLYFTTHKSTAEQPTNNQQLAQQLAQQPNMGNAMSGGGAGSPTKNEQLITDEMATYLAKWNSRSGPGVTPGSQTDVFRKSVPTGEEWDSRPADFTETFKAEQLDGIFTSEKIVLPMMGPYNSNHLFRDSQKETKIPVYSDDNYTVLHPLGEPGVHLGQGHGSKVSHLMIMKHSRDGPITFNEMLPSTMEEVQDLKTRMEVMNKVVQNFKDNESLYTCGPKVVAKANELRINGLTGIRDFLAKVISQMPEEERLGRPGYKLLNKDNVDVSTDEAQVRALLNDVYDNDEMEPFIAIQPPSENSQLLSHMHCFMVSSEPEGMVETYRDCDTILAIKEKHISLADRVRGYQLQEEQEGQEEQGEQEEREDDCELTRQSTRVS